jgi:hypothetical protein
VINFVAARSRIAQSNPQRCSLSSKTNTIRGLLSLHGTDSDTAVLRVMETVTRRPVSRWVEEAKSGRSAYPRKRVHLSFVSWCFTTSVPFTAILRCAAANAATCALPAPRSGAPVGASASPADSIETKLSYLPCLLVHLGKLE